MRLKQLIRKMSYNTEVKVLKIVKQNRATVKKNFNVLMLVLIADIVEYWKRSGQHLSMKSCQEQRILFLY